MAIGSGENAGSLVARNYADIRGVDFTNRKDEVSIVRSPDMLNVWKNYKSSNGLCIETRPALEKVCEYEEQLYGLFFFTYGGKKHKITHVGDKLYDEHKVILDGLNRISPVLFIYQTKLYIIDTKEYYVYDGETIKPVEGYIPITTISRAPLGGGTKLQDVNMLSPYRKNSFSADGETGEYHLDVESYDEDYKVKIWIDDVLVDNSKKVQVYDGNGYLKYTLNNEAYFYDDNNKKLYNSSYDEIVNNELHNSKGYIKYTKNGKTYWYDEAYQVMYDEDLNQVTWSSTDGYTKVTTDVTLAKLTKVIDYPYTESPSTGIITFSTPPATPLTDGSDNVIIQFRRTVKGYRERITNCTMVEQFDNRVFFSGNPNYPNVLWHCSLDDPTYCSDVDYYEEGVSDSAVKGIVAGNNALWVLKEPSQTNTTIFYHNPAIDSEYGKTYPSSHSSIATGCVGASENFNDRIIFFSDRGMEGISSDVTTEQVISHLSSFIDNRLLNEENYKNMKLAEFEGYLFVFINNHVYLADSRATGQVNNHNEYEWFYWELPINVEFVLVDDGSLYIGSDKTLYTLSNYGDREINSYITTFDDEMNHPQMRKITNKRGCTIDVEGTKVSLYVKTDKTDFEKIKDYDITNGRIVAKVKRKKWKSIQLKLEADVPFYFYSATLESYITNYLKK